MHNPIIGQEFRGPLHSRVTRVHVEPHGVHTKCRLRIALKEILLHPPGGFDTGRSRRRQQQHDSGFVAIPIEERLQLGDSREVLQDRRRGRIGRSCDRARNRPREPERRREAQPATNDDPIATRPHWPDGFLGTARVAVFGHGALMAVRHMLPRITLLLLGRRLIPDVDSAARGNSRHAVGLLNRRVADRDVISDPVVRGGRKHHDAIRIPDRRVALDQIVVGGPYEADAKIDKGARRVTISARLVPPERVIVALDSYAAACGGWRTVPHRDVAFDADARGRRVDANP